MNTPAAILCSTFIFFLVAITPCSSSSDDCTPSSCNDIAGPKIQFPFRVTGRQPERCGYPGFNLSCNDQGKTIITLPSTPGNFVVSYIDYNSQIIHISDPENCLSERISNISLAGSPFRALDDMRYTILSCSPEVTSNLGFWVPCLGNISKRVVAVPPRLLLGTPRMCTRVADNVSIPTSVRSEVPVFWGVVNWLELWWNEPYCRDCGSRDKLCGFSGDQGLEIGCSDPPHYSKGIPRSAEYGIIIGAAIPSLLCIVGIVFCCCGKIKKFDLNSHENQSTELPIITIMELPPMPTNGSGLDRLTIQSYPKIVLGESWQLPKPNDNTCPICLSEYQAEETLRSIPDCNHYFHANCIDEWLGLNATCPLCRKSPDSLETASQSSSISLSSTSQTSSSVF